MGVETPKDSEEFLVHELKLVAIHGNSWQFIENDPGKNLSRWYDFNCDLINQRCVIPLPSGRSRVNVSIGMSEQQDFIELPRPLGRGMVI